ncbi:xanthine dehydrogenase family protein molybdopterin-binding subunit, partial [Chloroflexota bacterium]
MAELSVVGKSVPRVDALEKVTGQATFTGDIKLPHMVYGKILRSPYPHAKIVKIDVSEAEKLAGVKAVVTSKDAPEGKVGLIQDRPILTRDVVRFVGEPVAAVAADTLEIAEEALDLIEVDYEELPAVFDPEEAAKPNPPVVIHPDLFSYPRGLWPGLNYQLDPELPNVCQRHKVRKGDVEKGFQEADLVVENRFTSGRVQHCALEPHGAIARVEPDGGLTLWASTQRPSAIAADLCRIFGVPPSKLRVIAPYCGGGFGSKASHIWPSPIAALLALKAGRSVKLTFIREEVFVDGTSDIPTVVYIKDGVKKDGTLLAREMTAFINSGAYSGTLPLITRAASLAAVGSYRVPNFKWDSYGVYTNEPPTGSFRGFGTVPILWAIESQMNIIAERLGINPVEIRRKNLLREGDEMATSMITYNIGAKDCLDKLAQWVGWGEKPPEEASPWKRGNGIALGSKFTAAGTTSVVTVKVHDDATIEIRHSAGEMGQGCDTVLAQIAAEEFATSVDKVKVARGDTAITPYDAGSVSSRTTFHTGNAVRLACQDAKRQIVEIASQRLRPPRPPESLEVRDGKIYIKGVSTEVMKIGDLFMMPTGWVPRGGELVGRGVYTFPPTMEDPETGQSEWPVAYYAHGACAAEIAVNVETGEVKVLRMAQCWDMAQPVNPKLCEAQMEGGTGMGIGRALYEELRIENGVTLNPNLVDYKLPSIMEVPVGQVESMIATPHPHREGPFGAKGFSEGGLVAVGPAIGNAIYDAVGVRMTDLPITREQVLRP